jgi:hypothetical protein
MRVASRAIPASEVTSPVFYDIDFRGGTTESFFRLLNSNGFTNDDVLVEDQVNSVRIPAFVLRSVPLSEIARSIEFVSRGALTVKATEKQPHVPNGGIIWRVGMNKASAAGRLKAKTCALPRLLRTSAGTALAEKIITTAVGVLEKAAHRLNVPRGESTEGDFKILQNEFIIVVVGTEAYVETVSSALEAAEASGASPDSAPK